jgi:hypothetical protein
LDFPAARKLDPTQGARYIPKVVSTPSTITLDPAEVVAIVDTNVLLDLVSCHDFVNAARADDDQKRLYRLRRVGEALHLAIYLNARKAATYSHVEEARDVAVREAPPEAIGLATEYVKAFLYFVNERLLNKWRMGALPASKPSSLRSNKADQMLVDLAKEAGCPVISNEGVTPMGIDPKCGLRRRATKACVQVLTPAEFYAGKLRKAPVERFMKEYVRCAPSFHKGQGDYADGQRLLRDIYEYYKRALEFTAVKPGSSTKRGSER